MQFKGLKFQGHIDPKHDIVLSRLAEVSRMDPEELRFLLVNTKEWHKQGVIDGWLEIVAEIDKHGILKESEA